MLKYRAVFVLVLLACVFAANLAGRALDGIDRRSKDYVPLLAGFDSLPMMKVGVTVLNFFSLGFLERSQHRKAMFLVGRADSAANRRAEWSDLALSAVTFLVLVIFAKWLAGRLVPG